MNNLHHLYNLEFNILQTLGPLPIYLLIFVAIYFIMIRPQINQQKKHASLLNNLKKGDKVITQGGIIGNITNFIKFYMRRVYNTLSNAKIVS